MLNRRGLILGLGALVAAPAVIRTAGLLMPVRGIPDRYEIRVRTGEVLSGQRIVAPLYVAMEPGTTMRNCTFVDHDSGRMIRFIKPGEDWAGGSVPWKVIGTRFEIVNS